jgi:hypothetical protein
MSSPEAAGVHRTTIFNWLNTCPAFGEAIDEGREAFQDRVCGEMSELTALARKTLREIMADPKASRSVRLKATIAVLKRSGQFLPAAPGQNAEQQLMEQLGDLGKEIQFPPPPEHPAATPRNTQCPCGSGLKFKRCCGVEAPPHKAAA